MILHIKYIGNDGDVVGGLSPMMYTLMVEATTNDDPPQHASDVVGPIIYISYIAIFLYIIMCD